VNEIAQGLSNATSLIYLSRKELLDVAGQTIMNVWCGCPHFVTVSTVCTEIHPLYEDDIPHEIIHESSNMTTFSRNITGPIYWFQCTTMLWTVDGNFELFLGLHSITLGKKKSYSFGDPGDGKGG